MHDAGLVRGLEPFGDLATDIDRFVERQRSALEARLHVLARNELERQEANLTHLVDAVDAAEERLQRFEREAKTLASA